ncbi:MAG: hypothetical protein CMD31_13205 [Flavobacteriales bacterium]|nr:hypothetical protein [Flavobacteriales bacterium]|tara:strand:- start:2321 stop:2815 length:495 start_codon:yes stop_codon:yes gene_type:complete
MFNKKKKNSRITDKIKSYMKDISIDLFSYEVVVSENIAAYLLQVASSYQSSANNIRVVISKNKALTGFLYDKSKQLRQVTTSELISFFMGEGSSELMEKKVTQQVLGYLSDYASAKGTNTEQLSIVIARPAQKIVVEAYREHQFIETIPLKQLITYFSNHPSNA